MPEWKMCGRARGGVCCRPVAAVVLGSRCMDKDLGCSQKDLPRPKHHCEFPSSPFIIHLSTTRQPDCGSYEQAGSEVIVQSPSSRTGGASREVGSRETSMLQSAATLNWSCVSYMAPSRHSGGRRVIRSSQSGVSRTPPAQHTAAHASYLPGPRPERRCHSDEGAALVTAATQREHGVAEHEVPTRVTHGIVPC